MALASSSHTVLVLSSSDIARFWSYVNKDGPVTREELGPCWVWTGGCTAHGYGQFYMLDGSQPYAHRVAYFLEHGTLPAYPNVLMHLCDNPPCVKHLKAGTQAENLQMSLLRGRGTSGTSNGNASMTREQVLAIREAWKTESIATLAERFNISKRTARRIVNYEVYLDVK